MSNYRDDLGAALAQNGILAAELERARKNIEEKGPREIPDPYDVALEFLMGWKGDFERTADNWTVLKFRVNTDLMGVAFIPKWTSKVKVYEVRYNWGDECWYKRSHLYTFVLGHADSLKKALACFYFQARKQ